MLDSAFVKTASIFFALIALPGGGAHAVPQPGPLARFPVEKLLSIGSYLRNTELALIETKPSGSLKQLTAMTLAQAPPEKVRDIVIHAERYSEFVRNMEESRVTPNKDGTFDHYYKVSYTVQTIYGRHRYVMLPQVSSSPAAPVDMYDCDDNGTRHFRWEFLPFFGGTVVVLYGYDEVPSDGFVGKVLRAVPTLEYGLALIPQMTLLLAMKSHAEQLYPTKVTVPVGTKVGSIGFLLERGMLALFRSQQGKLVDTTMMAETRAAPERVLSVIGQPTDWSHFIPSITQSDDRGQKNGVAAFEMEQSVPLMSWDTTFGLRRDKNSVDMFGLEGDLRGGRMRWDTQTKNGKTELVLRTQWAFDRSSVVMRQLYKLEPLFEYGVNVGMGLVLLRSVKVKAEQ